MPTIFSRGNLYTGTDDEKYTYVYLHICNFVLEWGGPTHQECVTAYDRSEARDSP